ncbi:hypothetical protein CQY23_11430 [Mycobacterium celatum]|uniref:Uncharacterized protein n=1 Tax=Mycobacterium celatum TaxID=28045 RepID=A0A2G5PKR1_MYCCE|nr:hypothetical protein CQY23_11430 [Mycobacterium celatum]
MSAPPARPRPAAARARDSARAHGGDPLHPASPRLRSARAHGGDPLHPASPRLRSPRHLPFSGSPRQNGRTSYA